MLRKKYSLLIQKKASEVAAVLGGEPDIYYGMIDTYCLSTVNELIELVLNQPDLITNLSSFKNEWALYMPSYIAQKAANNPPFIYIHI